MNFINSLFEFMILVLLINSIESRLSNEVAQCEATPNWPLISNGSKTCYNENNFVGVLFKRELHNFTGGKDNFTTFCSATVLNTIWLITSGQCSKEMSEFKDRYYRNEKYYAGAGADNDLKEIFFSNDNQRLIYRLFLHPSFKEGVPNKNLALVKLKTPFYLGTESSIYAVCFPKRLVNNLYWNSTKLRYHYASFKSMNYDYKDGYFFKPETEGRYSMETSLLTYEDKYCVKGLCYICGKNSIICMRNPQNKLCDQLGGGALIETNTETEEQYFVGIQVVLNRQDSCYGGIHVFVSIFEEIDWIQQHTGDDIILDRVERRLSRDLCACTHEPPRQKPSHGRLFQGERAPEHRFTFAVNLVFREHVARIDPTNYTRYFYGENLCSGSILSPSWVLTAGNCLLEMMQNKSRVYYALGGHDSFEAFKPNSGKSSTIDLGNSVINPHSRNLSNFRDFALLKLTTPFELGPKHNMYAACLDSELEPDEYVELAMAGFGAYTMGKSEMFGSSEEDKDGLKLQYSSQYLLHKGLVRYKGDLCYPDGCQPCNTPNLICGLNGVSSSCPYDSGGPVEAKNPYLKGLPYSRFLIGVISFKHQYTPRYTVKKDGKFPGLCNPNIPVTASIVQTQLDWIEQTVGQQICLDIYCVDKPPRVESQKARATDIYVMSFWLLLIAVVVLTGFVVSGSKSKIQRNLALLKNKIKVRPSTGQIKASKPPKEDLTVKSKSLKSQSRDLTVKSKSLKSQSRDLTVKSKSLKSPSVKLSKSKSTKSLSSNKSKSKTSNL